eukprot:3941996-Rhodomonas_salina.1
MSGTELAYGELPGIVLSFQTMDILPSQEQVRTGLAYCPTHSLRIAWYCDMVWCYASHGTELVHGASHRVILNFWYGATNSVVLNVGSGAPHNMTASSGMVLQGDYLQVWRCESSVCDAPME